MKEIWTTTERNARTMLGLSADAPLELVDERDPIAGKLALHVTVAPMKLYRAISTRSIVSG